MRSFSDFVVRGREFGRGQTMAEYVLIVAAIAVIAIGVFQNMGTNLLALIDGVDGLL
jgi:Flp pilus assembly pilin Flp